ncbi:MAG: hypothetical protein SPL21_13785 [Fibrobacter sp.]|nr:hypothetical protein [Fibrobacter sp.]
MGLFSSKRICAMCGKEEPEPQKGCLAADNRFKSYGSVSMGGAMDTWKFLKQQGLNPSDVFCPFCYNRLENMHKATRR